MMIMMMIAMTVMMIMIIDDWLMGSDDPNYNVSESIVAHYGKSIGIYLLHAHCSHISVNLWAKLQGIIWWGTIQPVLIILSNIQSKLWYTHGCTHTWRNTCTHMDIFLWYIHINFGRPWYQSDQIEILWFYCYICWSKHIGWPMSTL